MGRSELERVLTMLGRPAWDVGTEDVDRVVGGLVVAAFGMTPEATVGYLADHVDPDRLPALPRDKRPTC